LAHPIFARDQVTLVGILNLTPDSFSDGGRFTGPDRSVDIDAAVAAAKSLVEAGAHVIDVGGESTRPGSREVAASLEIERTQAVIGALAAGAPVPISIDTRKAAVARAALRAGATIVNDVSGLAHDPELADVAAEAGARLILGHMRGIPATMQEDPCFKRPIEEITEELAASVATALRAGVDAQKIVVDPGIGFGKRFQDNLEILARCGEIRSSLGLPLLVGPSRKGFLGELTGDPPPERDGATHAACAVAIFCGADAVRVHDVAGARRAAQVALALRRAQEAGASYSASGTPIEGAAPAATRGVA